MRSSSASRSRAATRLRCWDGARRPRRARSARASRASSRARWGRSAPSTCVTSYSSSTRLSVVLTDWPPGPGERLKRSTSSPAGISSPSGTPGPAGTRSSTLSPGSRHSMAGHVSITIGTPAAVVRAKASSSTTPSWNHTARAPTATAWSANSPAASERRNTSTTSIGNGTSASVGVALLTEHGRRGRVDRDDPLAASLEHRGDRVRRPVRVAGQPDDRPGLAVVEHEPDRLRVLPVARSGHAPSLGRDRVPEDIINFRGVLRPGLDRD